MQKAELAKEHTLLIFVRKKKNTKQIQTSRASVTARNQKKTLQTEYSRTKMHFTADEKYSSRKKAEISNFLLH